MRRYSFILGIIVNLLLFHFHEKVELYVPRNSGRPYYRLNASNILLYVITCNKTGNYVTSYALIKRTRVRER